MNKDKSMMATCISTETKELFIEWQDIEHPLDREVYELIEELNGLIRDDDDDFEIFRHQSKTDELWSLLISKAIKCLRYYDKREPFMQNSEKKPLAYGMDELDKYYKKYKEFESMLYGSNQYYRDHVVHVLRTWLSGVKCMVKNKGDYLNFISICDGEGNIELNHAEKLSIWTIIALTHDLGYPLEKAKGIVDTTRSMVSTFITNPDLSMDISFRGVQNYMNDYIVRLMSSKMKNKGTKEDPRYVARLQSKYYFKFQKSLEKTRHGIISTLIIYKLLTYFLESDYNINEDYEFEPEDRRQFYIRREILRAIASHTCTDVYHLYMNSFAFLLIIADDTQEWGRKYISELYIPTDKKYKLGDIDLIISSDVKNNPHKCKINEKLVIPEKKGPEAIIALLDRFRHQALNYVTIFRDGQETTKRDFSFIRELTVEYGSSSICFDMKLDISNNHASYLQGTMKYSSDGDKNKDFGKKFFEELKKKLGSSVEWKIFDENKKKAMSSEDKKAASSDDENSDPAKWRAGTFSIGLTN